MGFGTTFFDYLPITILAIVLAIMAACFAFVAVLLFSARFALGLDFGILVGLAASAVAGTGTFIFVLSKGRSYMSN